MPRYGVDGLTRSVLKHFLPRPALFNPAMRLGQMMRPLLPAALKAKVPERRDPGATPAPRQQRSMIVLAGCVQPAMLPGINAAAARVLDRLGISLVEAERAGCCGALRLHLDDAEGARDDARRNIDAWLPLLDAGHEAIVMTASGCGVQVRDYAHLLQDDPRYAIRAARVALATRDISEVVIAEKAALLELLQRGKVGAGGTAPRGFPFLLHPAAWPEDSRRGRGTARWRPASTLTPVTRRPPVLRFGRHLLGAAAARSRRSCATTSSAGSASAAQGARARGHRQRQHRLHHPSAERHGAAGAALDRIARRAPEVAKRRPSP